MNLLRWGSETEPRFQDLTMAINGYLISLMSPSLLGVGVGVGAIFARHICVARFFISGFTAETSHQIAESSRSALL